MNDQDKNKIRIKPFEDFRNFQQKVNNEIKEIRKERRKEIMIKIIKILISIILVFGIVKIFKTPQYISFIFGCFLGLVIYAIWQEVI